MKPLLSRPKAALGGSSSPSPRAKGEGGYTSSSAPATRLLDQHARDMVRLALQGRYDPVTGREEEITYEISLSGRKKQTPQVLQKQLMELQGVCSVNFVSYSGEVIG